MRTLYRHAHGLVPAWEFQGSAQQAVLLWGAAYISSLPCRRAALVAFVLAVALAPARCGVVPRRSKAAGRKPVDGVFDQYASLVTSAPPSLSETGSRMHNWGFGCTTLVSCWQQLLWVATGNIRPSEAVLSCCSAFKRLGPTCSLTLQAGFPEKRTSIVLPTA